MTHDVHENYAADWQTPPEWIDWARETMGGIDLDPCASVNPGDWFAADSCCPGVADDRDGLTAPWHGRVYVNPPGSNSTRSVKRWWAKAMDELNGRASSMSALVWCFFNVEAARVLKPSPFDVAGWFTVPQPRVAFWRDGGPIKQPRNWTWFWSTLRPATPPVASWFYRTGSGNVVAVGPNGQNGARIHGSSSETQS